MNGRGNSGRKVKGTSKASQANSNQTKPSSTFDKRCPRHLNVDGKRFWTQILEDLRGIVQNKDFFALEQAAMLYQNILKLQRVVNKKGHTFIRKTDRKAENVAVRPEVQLLKGARTEFKNFLLQFGLTPKAGVGMPKASKPGNKGSVGDRYKT